MYYGDPYNGTKQEEEALPMKRPRNCNPLDLLLSPVRTHLEFENWTPFQVAVFECGMCQFGKEFSLLEKLLGYKKTTAEIAKFYHLWKATSHYKVWKENVKKLRCS